MSKDKPQPIINNAKASPQYKQGVNAYINEEPRDSNPYVERSYKFTEWDRGWFKSFMKGKPIG